jgi:hypothetical protein
MHFYWVQFILLFSSVVILVTGTIFAMWLGKRLQIKELEWYFFVNHGLGF